MEEGEQYKSLRDKPFSEIAKIVAEEVSQQGLESEEAEEDKSLQEITFSEIAETATPRRQDKELDVTYANLGVRVAAYLIDTVILMLPNAAILLLTFPEYNNLKSLSFIINILYFAISESSPAQATFGKRIMNLRVIGKSGNRVSFGRAVLGYLSKIISVVPLCAGVLTIRTDDKHQGWHDMIAGTYVIENK